MAKVAVAKCNNFGLSPSAILNSLGAFPSIDFQFLCPLFLRRTIYLNYPFILSAHYILNVYPTWRMSRSSAKNRKMEASRIGKGETKFCFVFAGDTWQGWMPFGISTGLLHHHPPPASPLPIRNLCQNFNYSPGFYLKAVRRPWGKHKCRCIATVINIRILGSAFHISRYTLFYLSPNFWTPASTFYVILPGFLPFVGNGNPGIFPHPPLPN